MSEPFPVRIPLPPTTNHAYKLALIHGRPALVKTDALRAWEQGARVITGGWEYMAHTRLAVAIRLEVPAGNLRRSDIDGYLKALIDVVVGKRADQWVDELHVTKAPGDGWATVEVRVLEVVRT